MIQVTISQNGISTQMAALALKSREEIIVEQSDYEAFTPCCIGFDRDTFDANVSQVVEITESNWRRWTQDEPFSTQEETLALLVL